MKETRTLELNAEELQFLQTAVKFFSDYIMQKISRMPAGTPKTEKSIKDGLLIVEACENIRAKANEHIDPDPVLEMYIKDMFPYGL